MKLLLFAVLVMLVSTCLLQEIWSDGPCPEEEECTLYPNATCSVICWKVNAVDTECQYQHFVGTERVICTPD